MLRIETSAFHGRGGTMLTLRKYFSTLMNKFHNCCCMSTPYPHHHIIHTPTTYNPQYIFTFKQSSNYLASCGPHLLNLFNYTHVYLMRKPKVYNLSHVVPILHCDRVKYLFYFQEFII